jgi:DNA-binding transcriptional LysR family regulator
MTPEPGETPLLDSKQLRLFELLCSTRSVSQSAQALGQCQPTVSIWLSKLRRQLGDPLFIKTAQGMQPTPRALALLPTVRSALDALRQLKPTAAAFEPALSTRRFRICMTDASHVTLLPQLLAQVRTLAPQVTLEAARMDDNTAEALQSGQADLAIGLVPWLESGFYQQALFAQDWVCLVQAQHPRIGQVLERRIYKEEGHIGITAGTGSQLLAQALVRHRVQRHVVLELPGFLGLAGGGQHRPGGHAAAPHWRDPGPAQWPACAALPYSHSRLYRQTALARTLPPGARQRVAAWPVCGPVHAAPGAGGSQAASLTNRNPRRPGPSKVGAGEAHVLFRRSLA